jgi:hypothetical protein
MNEITEPAHHLQFKKKKKKSTTLRQKKRNFHYKRINAQKL